MAKEKYDKEAARKSAAEKKGRKNFTKYEIESYKAGAKNGQRSGYIKAAKKFNPK